MPISSVSGLVARWRASDLALADGASVPSWTDNVGSFTASQATSTLQPLYRATGFNGHPGVEFNGSTQYLDSTSNTGLLNAVGGVTIIAAIQTKVTPASATPDVIVITGGTGATSARIKIGPRTTRALEVGGRKLDADTYRQVNGTAIMALNTYYVVGGDLDFSANAAHSFINGAADNTASSLVWGSGSLTSATNPLNVWLGGQGAANSYYGGVIAEIFVYNRVLSSSDRAIIDSYMQDTYGITVSDYNASWNGAAGAVAMTAATTTLSVTGTRTQPVAAAMANTTASMSVSGVGVQSGTVAMSSATASLSVTPTLTQAATVSMAAGTATLTATGSVPSPNTILEVVNDANATLGTLSTDSSGQWLYNYFTGAGYVVTLIGHTGTPSNLSNYGLVWIANSVPTTADITTPGYTATSVPVVGSGVRSPHPNYSSSSPTTPTGTQNFVHIKAAGVGAPQLPSDITTEQDLIYQDNAYNQRYVGSGTLGSGVHQVASDTSSTLNNISWSYYNAGDTMSSGTAPSKRAWFMMHPGSMGTNARGEQVVTGLIRWATGHVEVNGAVAMSATTSTLSASTGLTRTGAVAMSSTGSMSVAATVTQPAAVAMTSTSALTVTAAAVKSVAVAMSATCSMTITATVFKAAVGTGTLSLSATTTSSGSKSSSGTGVRTATITLTSSGAKGSSGSGSQTLVVTMVSVGSKGGEGVATLTAVTVLTSDGAKAGFGTATLFTAIELTSSGANSARLRDIDVVVGALITNWSAGQCYVNWLAGSSTTGWAAGPVRS